MKVPRRLKGLLLNIGLAIGSLVVMFGILELGFRVVEAFNSKSRNADESWAIYDEDLKYRPRPHYDDFNSDGLRDDPIDPVKTRFRILMLGDSVAFYGDSIDDTYVGHLETMLSGDSYLTPTEVINAGVRGYTNYQELQYLEKYGLDFEPDLVGVGFVLNDLHRYLHEFKVENGEIVGEYFMASEAVQSVDSPLYQLARKSHLLVWLRQRLSVFENLIELQIQDGFTFDYRPDFNPAWKEESWIAIEEQLHEMVQLGQQHDFRVFVVVFPFGQQYRADYLAKDYDYVTMPQRRLRAICASLDIPCLDLYPVLDREVHIDTDEIHLTKLGRAAAAAEIAAFLKAQGLVPGQSSTNRP